MKASTVLNGPGERMLGSVSMRRPELSRGASTRSRACSSFGHRSRSTSEWQNTLRPPHERCRSAPSSLRRSAATPCTRSRCRVEGWSEGDSPSSAGGISDRRGQAELCCCCYSVIGTGQAEPFSFCVLSALSPIQALCWRNFLTVNPRRKRKSFPAFPPLAEKTARIHRDQRWAWQHERPPWPGDQSASGHKR